MSGIEKRRGATRVQDWANDQAARQVAESTGRASGRAGVQSGPGSERHSAHGAGRGTGRSRRRQSWRTGTRLGDGPPPDTPEALAVRARMREAADVFSRLPNGDLRHIGDMRAKWPTVVRDTVEAYGWDKTPTRMPPSAAAIDRAEAAVMWLLEIGPSWSKVLWCWALGLPMKKIAPQLNISTRTGWRIWRAAVDHLGEDHGAEALEKAAAEQFHE
jgi:hypothetical protein